MIRESLKSYFTTKADGNFWKWAFFTLLLFSMFKPLTLNFIIPFQVGLVTPNASNEVMDEQYTNMVVTLSEKIGDNVFKLIVSGQEVSRNNPTMGKILFFLIGAVIYMIYLSMVLLILQLARYTISYLVKAKKQEKLLEEEAIKLMEGKNDG